MRGSQRRNKKKGNQGQIGVAVAKVSKSSQSDTHQTASAGSTASVKTQPESPTPTIRSEPSTGTMQQRRARFALEAVTRLKDELSDKEKKEFNSYASAMPFMIHANGLGQTAAFYRRKGEKHTYYRLYKLLGQWLGRPDQPFAGRTDLLEGVTQADMGSYLVAQAEAMMFLDWVKKFATAFLGDGKSEASL